MSFTSPSGEAIISCYWKIVQCNIGYADRNAKIDFYGFLDKASADAGKASIGGAVKSYSIGPDKFDQYFGTTAEGTAGFNPRKLGYQLSVDVKDVSIPQAAVPTPRVYPADVTSVDPVTKAVTVIHKAGDPVLDGNGVQIVDQVVPPPVLQSYFAGASDV